MSSSHRLKERHKRGKDDEEGTAARTRPLSAEEIVVNRKRKSFSKDHKERALEPEIVSRKENDVRNDSTEKGFRQKKDSPFVDERNISSGRKNEKGTSVNTKPDDREGQTLGRKLKSVISRPNDDASNEIKDGRNDKRVHEKRSMDFGRNEASKKGSRDLRGKESRTERIKTNPKRERKRKYQNDDDNDDKNKERTVLKKLDTKRHYESKASERNMRIESSKLRIEEPETRRRGRSRSQDRGDRNRRSRSPTTARAHKNRSSHNRTIEREASPKPTTDRSQKQHHKLSSNGSSIGHYRRHDEPKSGLGGYSPRKRISEAAAMTPPPPDQSSSEKKSAKWDILPQGSEKILSGPVSSVVPMVVQESASTVHFNSAYAKLQSLRILASVDSVQLTQATRPMRRLFVDNVPSTTSEKDLVKWFNDLFLSLSVNHVLGTEPCINCIINKDKAQALVEFLTPEDASTALSFDGRLISDSILKIRRPKDFVEVATGDLGKSVAAVEKTVPVVNEVSDVVKDSPNKIFIGGISKTLSSKMLMEIVSSFGPLKSYRFEVNGNPDEPHAFLEFVDQSITHKACSGLNGMKLDGKVLTVVQALRSAESVNNTESSPSYEIPEHAKPLLKKPTQVLKLKNVFNVEDFSSLTESEVEEVVEDIRLECARFGNIKSVNVVKQLHQLNDDKSQPVSSVKTENSEQNLNYESNGIELQENGIEKKDSVTENKSPQPNRLDSPKQTTQHEFCDKPEENQTLGVSLKAESGTLEKKQGESDALGKKQSVLERVFERGYVFVEFGRPEAACSAAHCLHGRVFDSRVVSVDFVALDYYKLRFP